MFLNLLFIYLFFMILLSSFLVIFTQNSIFSALFLISSFIFSALIFFMLECELLGFIFFIVYIGAIAVLFVFVVMLIDIKGSNLLQNSLQYFTFGFLISIVFLLEIGTLLTQSFKFNYCSDTIFLNQFYNWYTKLELIYEITVLGHLIYSNFVLAFLLIGILLFLVIIGVVALTLELETNNSQIHLRQLTRTFNRAVFFSTLK